MLPVLNVRLYLHTPLHLSVSCDRILRRKLKGEIMVFIFISIPDHFPFSFSLKHSDSVIPGLIVLKLVIEVGISI